VLLLSDYESGPFLRQLRDVDVKAAPPAPPAAAAAIAPSVQKALHVRHTLPSMPRAAQRSAAMLGHRQGRRPGCSVKVKCNLGC